jgi:hypothetical protein
MSCRNDGEAMSPAASPTMYFAYESALAVGSRAKAERYQHLLPGARLGDGLPQHGIGSGAVPLEMGCVEPEPGGVTPDGMGNPTVIGVQA